MMNEAGSEPSQEVRSKGLGDYEPAQPPFRTVHRPFPFAARESAAWRLRTPGPTQVGASRYSPESLRDRQTEVWAREVKDTVQNNPKSTGEATEVTGGHLPHVPPINSLQLKEEDVLQDSPGSRPCSAGGGDRQQ